MIIFLCGEKLSGTKVPGGFIFLHSLDKNHPAFYLRVSYLELIPYMVIIAICYEVNL